VAYTHIFAEPFIDRGFREVYVYVLRWIDNHQIENNIAPLSHLYDINFKTKICEFEVLISPSTVLTTGQINIQIGRTGSAADDLTSRFADTRESILNIITTRRILSEPLTLTKAIVKAAWLKEAFILQESPFLLNSSEKVIREQIVDPKTPLIESEVRKSDLLIVASSEVELLIAGTHTAEIPQKFSILNSNKSGYIRIRGCRVYSGVDVASNTHKTSGYSDNSSATTASGTYQPESISKFQSRIKNFTRLIDNATPFAFNRISDGELAIVRNMVLRLGIDDSRGWQLGTTRHESGYFPDEERKSFIPERDWRLRKELLKAMRYSAPNYFIGLTNPCCINQHRMDRSSWEVQLTTTCETHPFLIEANTLINGNYSYFIQKLLPKFANYLVISAFNYRAQFGDLPFEITRSVEVGDNCLVQWEQLLLDCIEAISQVVKMNKRRPILFITSCSTAAKILIYRIFKLYPRVTCIDVGSSLNPIVGLSGWQHSRGYLQEYWLLQGSGYTSMNCEHLNS